jgi:16S rRNA (adenine1518-N6/adenine1519-N6)-dimethyltransferase
MDRNHRRKYGQNFLNSPEIAAGLLEDLPYNKESHILEIGPGHGAMTRVLLPRVSHITAVEIDLECVKYLRYKHSGEKRLTLVHQSFLDFDLESFLQQNPGALIMGNLPYNVATPILCSIFPHLSQTGGVLAMVQYEVAQRLAADPGCSDYGYLTVLLQCWGKCRILRKVPREHFTPRPNVMSATVFIEADPNAVGLNREELYFVQECFKQKRKKLINSLQSWYPKTQLKQELSAMNISEMVRAEELTPLQFKQLYQRLGPLSASVAVKRSVQ